MGSVGILEHLKIEHQWIRKLLSIFDYEIARIESQPTLRGPDVDHLEDWLRCLRLLVGDCHHEKEEEILFPLIGGDDRIRHGGPRCGYFFKYVMDETYVADIKKGIQELHTKPQLPTKTPEVQKLFQENSPLTIPLEEHEYGFYGLHLLDQQIQNLKNNLAGDRNLLRRYFAAYNGLMDLHIRKENECLFVMANELISPEMQMELHQKALDFEEKFGREKISGLMEKIGRHPNIKSVT